MIETPLRHFKGQKLICGSCNSLIAVFARDVFTGEPIAENMFTDEGQGPWRFLDRLICRDCGMPFFDWNHFTAKII